ncbi:MAG: Cna B-type domain-containing protein, partial [Clostridia bacterium]|nr:Cna B-type domain-containing protein [Clostridia bacterium]
VITNTYHPDVETDEIKVIKVWDDNGNTDMRPSSVVVELLAGNKVFDTVTLNELNNWQHRWTGLDVSTRWSVREKYIPDGYTDFVTRSGNTFIITNTLNATEETVSRQVIKIWEDKGYEENRPAEITVELLADGQVYDTVVLNANNHWMYQWNGLNKDTVWSIKEADVPENYTSVITSEGSVFVITNTYTPPYTPPEPVDRTVLKVWKNDGAHLEERPAEVQVALLCNGEVYEVVALNEENGWAYSWTGLDGTKEWTIVEYTVLDKYTSSVTQDGSTFIITNTYSDIPQTGQLWWPVPMLLALGLGMIVVGLVRRRGAEYEE